METEGSSRRSRVGGAPAESQEACYVISVVARMVGVHAQTLRAYERLGLVAPSRSQGNIRLYSQQDLEQLRRIKTLIDDLGVNLAGVEVILRMMGRMAEMERNMQALLGEVERLRALARVDVGPEESSAPPS
ncbi:MAG: helix-turn-helix transcriptional regulator [Chloroflexi bacterium]|nr:helix-turn-helix transcriptional regulator [Chloroflexota bacterium]